MAALTVQDGKLVVRDGKVGTEQGCCCGDGDGDDVGCGTTCQQTVSVPVAVAGYSHTLAFTVADEFANYSEFAGFDYFLVSASIFCSDSSGSAVWTLTVSVCWQSGANNGSETWEGTINADGSGCPQTGAVTMAVTFGNGDATVTASIT